jgi:hypothetical protein
MRYQIMRVVEGQPDAPVFHRKLTAEQAVKLCQELNAQADAWEMRTTYRVETIQA